MVVVLALAACRREPVQTFRRAPVVLISVDTLRSDHLPAYGYRGVKTPNIDALRRDSILFQRAYSQCPMTLPSHVSILTGLLPTEHGVRNNIGYHFDGGKFRTLAGVLRSNGYRTGAAVSSYVLRSETGVSQGFDTYDDSIPVAAGAADNQVAALRTSRLGDRAAGSPGRSVPNDSSACGHREECAFAARRRVAQGDLLRDSLSAHSHRME